MVQPLTLEEFNKIRKLVESHSGIALNEDQDYLVESRLTELANELGLRTFADLAIKMAYNTDLMSRCIDLMTIKETLWFRDDSCWKTLEELIIPGLVKKSERTGRTIRIWSAACSTGQEPYSLAILIDELTTEIRKSKLAKSFEILGTDISNSALDMARSGCYDRFSINRGRSERRISKHFREDGNKYVLNETIRNRVKFQYFNLQNTFAQLGKFDLILCRNVAIYFSLIFKKELFRKIASVMNPDAYMILGATESLFGISSDFESFSYKTGLYFQIKQNQ